MHGHVRWNLSYPRIHIRGRRRSRMICLARFIDYVMTRMRQTLYALSQGVEYCLEGVIYNN